MMNLLPENEKNKLSQERMRRLLMVVGLSLASLFALGAALILPTYLSLLSQKRALNYQLTVTESNPGLKEIGDIEQSINDFNSKLTLFEQGEEKIQPVASVLEEALATRQGSITFKNIGYKRDLRTSSEELSIQGNATHRDALLDFVKNLEKLDSFKKVDLPVTSLLKETDIDFQLTLELNSS